VHAEREHGRVAGEDGVRPVALVHVEVDHHRAADATVPLQHANRDGDIVEHAESLAVIGKRVVRPAGEVHREATLERGGGRLTRPADGAERPLNQRFRPGQADASLFRVGQRSCAHRLDVTLGVNESQGLHRRSLRLVDTRGRHEPARDHRVAKQGVLRDRKAMIRRERERIAR